MTFTPVSTAFGFDVLDEDAAAFGASSVLEVSLGLARLQSAMRWRSEPHAKQRPSFLHILRRPGLTLSWPTSGAESSSPLPLCLPALSWSFLGFLEPWLGWVPLALSPGRLVPAALSRWDLPLPVPPALSRLDLPLPLS